MLTQCPSCNTIFRVTREILLVADGQVRCGRCQTQFDALERLVHEEPVEEIEAPGDPDLDLDEELDAQAPQDTAGFEDEHATDDIEGVAAEEDGELEEITLEGNHIEITGTYRVMNENGEGTAVRQQVTEEWVEIEDIDEDLDAKAHSNSLAGAQPDEIDVGDFAGEHQQVAREFAAERTFAPPAAETAAPPVAAFRRRLAREDEHLDLLPARTSRQHNPLLWGLLAVLLVGLLAAQVVHHYRGDLARHPRVGELLMRVYGALDLPLTPEWDLHAYEIRQWGVVADPDAPGTLRVRASITNRADFAQPYPLLKLILEDRWGDQVRARAFEPAEYLDPAISPDRLLAPTQQANATIAIVDPGPDAEGFRFDVCLHGAAGPVCAADLPAPR